MSKVQKLAIVYEENQGAIFLAMNRKVGMRKQNIDKRHHLMREILEEKDTDIKYIRIK